MSKRLDPQNPSEGNEEGLWARSWALPYGKGYGIRINVGETSWTMGRDAALAYAAAFVAAATAAEHDTAVFRMMTDRMGLDPAVVVAVIGRDIRPDRPTNADATRPVVLAPAVGQKGPFVKLLLNEEQVGELTPADAREHALAVLDALAAGDLDSALRRVLVGPVGIDEARASAVIASLADYWPEGGAARSLQPEEEQP